MTSQLSNQSSLQAWFDWLESLDPGKIELGLDRVNSAWQKAGVQKLAPVVITVAGTNGKGSSVGMLENILCRGGYKVGAYTSPHIYAYNERIRINAENVDDATLVTSFARVRELQADTKLTYFEFGTLAAFDIFSQHDLDIVLLEVGLGGRLDAVNIIDADIALVTSIDIDHVDWLGRDRESIGFEKAGVFRQGKPAICADANPPASLLAHARANKVPLTVLGQDFGFTGPSADGETWSWWSKDAQGEMKLADLPVPGLGGGVQFINAAGVLAVLAKLPQPPLTLEVIRDGLASAHVAGRFEYISRQPDVLLDVAHNPQSARALAEHLQNTNVAGRTLAVFGCMADKDIRGIVEPLVGHIDNWYIAAPRISRAAAVSDLQETLVSAAAKNVTGYDSVESALAKARVEAGRGDRIVVFGSFYTVAEAASKPV